MASCVPGELIPCAFVWHDPGITPCCKTLVEAMAVEWDGALRERFMMGRREGGQGQFFYAFDLDEVVPRSKTQTRT